MEKRFIKILFISALLGLSPAARADSYREAGTTGVNFIKIPIAAIPTALGGAYTAMSGPDSALYNPAGLGMLTYNTFSATHNQYVMDIKEEYLSTALRFPWGVVGATYQGMLSGDIERRDSSDNLLGNYSVSDNVVSFSYAKSWPYFPEDDKLQDRMIITPLFTGIEPVEVFRPKSYRLSVGGTLKYIYSDYYEATASAFAADAGVLLVLPGRWQLGASAMNFGTKIKYVSESYSLPQVVRIGVAKDFHNANEVMILTLTADAMKYKDSDFTAAGGAELNILRLIQLRIGYKAGQSDDLASLTAGAGFSLDRLSGMSFLKGSRFDYAYMNYDKFGATHRFSVQFAW